MGTQTLVLFAFYILQFSFLFSLKKHHIFTADLFFMFCFCYFILSGLGSGDEMVKWLNTNLPIISPWL